MKVVILSPLLLEIQAVMDLFTDLQKTSKGGRSYTTTQYKNGFCGLELAFRQTGSGLMNIALATDQAIGDWQPTVVLLVGIAGSVKDPDIGDLVIATKAYSYDAGKETPTGFAARPEVVPTTPLMLELAQRTASSEQWRSISNGVDYTRVIHFGPIAAGDKVVANTDSVTYKIIKQYYNDTQAVEMESIAFAKACLHHPLVQCLNIRGISDRIDGKAKADAGGSQPKAAAAAAAFAKCFLQELDPSLFNFTAMELKPLVEKVMEFVLPVLKLEAGQEIGKELKEATNTTIRELWTKVKPLFIEEFEEYKEDPDAENLAALKAKLRRSLKANETLQQELSKLVERSEATPEGKVIITNSKNVIYGSNINVGGDFRLGDDFH